VTAPDGARLRAALFPCDGFERQGRGSVVLSPGRTEPIEKYYEVIDELRGRGFAVLAHDWRGQGLSARMLKDRRRGHAVGTDPFLADFNAVIAAHEHRLPKPWVALGHSMGGGLTALALVEGESRFAAAALSSPMLGVNLGGRPASLVLGLSGLLVRLGLGHLYIPAWTDPLEQPFRLGVLTHDERRWNRFRDQMLACPDLRLGGATWGWVEFALKLSAAIQRPGAVEAVATPLVAFLAAEEALVDNQLIRDFARRAPNGALIELAGARHELFMETDPIRDTVWAGFDALLGQAGI
jgi:lysophospholipase